MVKPRFLTRVLAGVLAVALGALVSATSASANVYYATEGGVWSAPYTGATAPVRLSSSTGDLGVALVGSEVFYTRNVGGRAYIGRVETDGSNDDPTWAPLPAGTTIGDSITASGSNMFFDSYSSTYDPGGPVAIGEVNPSGSLDASYDVLGNVGKEYPDPPAYTNIFDVASDPESHVWWSYASSASAGLVGGSTSEFTLQGNLNQAVDSVLEEGGHMYAATYDNTRQGHIYQTDLAGNVTQTLGGATTPERIELSVYGHQLFAAILGSGMEVFDLDGSTDPLPAVSDAPMGTIAGTPDAAGSSSPSSQTSLSCIPDPVVVGDATTCTATVTEGASPAPAGTPSPTGTVDMISDSAGVFSAYSSTCTLSASAPGAATCALTYSPLAVATATLTAGYSGDGLLQPSYGQTTVTSVAAPATPPPSEPGSGGSGGGGNGSGSGSGAGGNGSGSGGGSHARLGKITDTGTTASVPVACPASGPNCMLTGELTATGSSGDSSEVTAGDRRLRKALVLGRSTVTIRHGHSGTLKVKLGGGGRRLLAAHRRLKVLLTVTQKIDGRQVVVHTGAVKFGVRG
ncbi:MAG TPA: Ig-like domain-containing protein [Solirubrobacterales bacterium]|nr:Ig-like domain-containing protein [Solirubrobacterales bacterium]